MENIDVGTRRYLGGIGSDSKLGDEVTDFYGNTAPDFREGILETASKQLIYYGTASLAGRWQFVAEVRDSSTTRVLRKAYEKFVVSRSKSLDLNPSGNVRSIGNDATWSSGTLYRIRNAVNVTSGATLTIQAGTLIRASGAQASIVVEKGGRIVVNGRRESPVSMICDQQIGNRAPGCWGGLIIRGKAPVSMTADSATASMTDSEPAYGGDDPNDSSGTLRFLRVEFAGGAAEDATEIPAGVGLFGVGSGTVIEHVQVHEAAGDGIAFRGGTAWCKSCVSTGAGSNALDWDEGWSGGTQQLFIHQDGQSQHGIHASGASSNSGAASSACPLVYNATLVGHMPTDSQTSTSVGMMVRDGAELFARNVLVTGFGCAALRVAGEGARTAFTSGSSSVRNAIAYDSGGSDGPVKIEGDDGNNIAFTEADPMLFMIRYEANPDPWPEPGSPAITFGSAAIPAGNSMLSWSAQYIGAFGYRNWLEEWTFFGLELAYRIGSSSR